ncbi:IclR family transcriptional regulator [Streptomyces sp. NPDC060209]|uniref:IclR family transcriptional regulator n=1 Tax=Streptomyces sp. NPDC060209 TaxID=3347073 RepID=UPI0036613587
MARQDAPDPAPSRPAGAQTVERAFEVLQCLRTAPGPVGVSDIARSLGLNVSSVYRMARALEKAGFLEQDLATRRYRLGSAIAGLNRVLHHQRRFDLARPELQRLARETSGSAALALRDRNEVLVVSDLPAAEAPDDWSTRVANSVPLHASAFGKALLAWPGATEAELESLTPLEQFTERTINSTERLRDELEATRERGYAVSNRELYPLQLTVAVPILNQDGGSYLALGVGTTWSRATAARLRTVARQVQDGARRLRPLLVPDSPGGW